MTQAARRKRVAHVSLGLDIGGQERLLLEFARFANHERYELVVVSLTTRGRLAEDFEALNVRVLDLNLPGGFRPSIALRLARLFRELDVDVVHTHDDKPLIYGQPAGWWAQVPARVHTHHHGRLPIIGWRQDQVIRFASRFCPTLVCVSFDSARYLQERGVAVRRLQTIHNGINLARFPFHGPNPQGPVVCVARLSPEKSIQTLVRAARLLVERGLDFRLEIAGDGPCREELMNLTAELQLLSHVHFLGEIRDVPGLLARARVFVLPSRTEGVSLTILEAMARGLPVVATRVGGNPEVILEDNTGILVPAQDPEALAVGLERILHHPEEGNRLGLAGRHRVEQHFDVQQMVARYEALYEQVPGTNGAGPHA